MDAMLIDDPKLVDLNAKLDALTEQVAFLTEEAALQRQRRREWEDLRNDLTPVMSDAYRLAVDQLEEVESYVQLEDVARLLKRLMRNTRNLEQLLDQVESLNAMWQDITPLTQSAFLLLMNQLDRMEREGYFLFLNGGMSILDKVVASFSQEDIEQLGDNIVLILQTLKEMTQPAIMHLLRNTASVMREDSAEEDVSMLTILRQLNDPAVKRGLSKTLTVLSTVSDS